MGGSREKDPPSSPGGNGRRGKDPSSPPMGNTHNDTYGKKTIAAPPPRSATKEPDPKESENGDASRVNWRTRSLDWENEPNLSWNWAPKPPPEFPPDQFPNLEPNRRMAATIANLQMSGPPIFCLWGLELPEWIFCFGEMRMLGLVAVVFLRNWRWGATTLSKR